MKLRSITNYALYFFIIAALSACGNSSDTDSIADADTAEVNKTKDNKAQEVFYSIPSPIETIALLKSAGAKYNSNFLNPVENVSHYASVTEKALNLGIYGSDLSYTSMYDQTQESMLFLRCANKLATSLGISGAFDENMTARLEANMQNRDSLLAIISDSYWTTDTYLKENGQPGISGLIIAGGWIEGLYIGTQIATKTKNQALTTRIGEQKLSLENLIALLETYKTDNSGIASVLTDLKELNTVYGNVVSASTETHATTDTNNKITTLENSNTFDLSVDKLKEITEKAAAIRNKIIK